MHPIFTTAQPGTTMFTVGHAKAIMLTRTTPDRVTVIEQSDVTREVLYALADLAVRHYNGTYTRHLSDGRNVTVTVTREDRP